MSFDRAGEQGDAVQAVTIDLSDERFGEGVPFETFAYLRANAPVWRWPEGDCWVVTPHALVEQMNRDFPTYSSAGGIVPPDGGNVNPAVLLAMDPPLHTEYRRMVNRSFVPRAIGSLEADVRRIAEEAVAAFVAAGGGDFVEVAAAIPFRVMAQLTGVPRSAERMVMGWGNAIAPNADPDYRPHPGAAAEANEALSAFLGEQFAERRRNPGDDLLSQLLEVRRADGQPLEEGDLRGFALNYLLGGTETTRNLLAPGLLALLEHPDQLRRYVEGAVASDTLVDELLRWVTPVMHHSRWVTRSAEVAGQSLEVGDRVTLWMISANRDEHAFERADHLDVGRHPNHHVSLGGGGPHYCLGAHLAKLEAVATFEALRPVLGRLRLTGAPARVRSNFINGMKRLPLEVGA